MSIRAMVWALDAEIKEPIAKLILVTLADHADDASFKCWPSAGHIAKRLHMSKTTVYKYLSYLKSNGFIEHIRQYHPNGWNRSPLFKLLISQPSPQYGQAIPPNGGPSPPSADSYNEPSRTSNTREGYSIKAGSEEWDAWRRYFQSKGKKFALGVMEEHQLSRREFPVGSRFPPS